MHLPFGKGVLYIRTFFVQFSVIMQAMNTHLLNLIVLNKTEKAAGWLEKTK